MRIRRALNGNRVILSVKPAPALLPLQGRPGQRFSENQEILHLHRDRGGIGRYFSGLFTNLVDPGAKAIDGTLTLYYQEIVPGRLANLHNEVGVFFNQIGFGGY